MFLTINFAIIACRQYENRSLPGHTFQRTVASVAGRIRHINLLFLRLQVLKQTAYSTLPLAQKQVVPQKCHVCTSATHPRRNHHIAVLQRECGRESLSPFRIYYHCIHTKLIVTSTFSKRKLITISYVFISGWVSSSPTLPVVVVDEADDPQEKPKPAFDFRQGILVLPPLPQQSPISGRAVLRRVAPETHSSTETNPQQENRVASIIRRAHSHHDIS